MNVLNDSRPALRQPAPAPSGAGVHERFSAVLDKEYFHFAAAHFLVFADGTREPLHGHNYRAELELETDRLDRAGLVADFVQIKPVFKAACDRLDHRVLVPARNEHLTLERTAEGVRILAGGDAFSFPAADVVVLELENTACELLARWLCEQTLAGLAARSPGLRPTRIAVSVSESPGQAARCERSFPLAQPGTGARS